MYKNRKNNYTKNPDQKTEQDRNFCLSDEVKLWPGDKKISETKEEQSLLLTLNMSMQNTESYVFYLSRAMIVLKQRLANAPQPKTIGNSVLD